MRGLISVSISVSAVLGCSPSARPSVTNEAPASSAMASSAIAPSSVPSTKRLDGEPLEALRVDGYGDAVVSLPLGAREKTPVLIAVHGNYDRPEWQCGTWRAIVKDRAFVLCPRGIPRTDSPSADDVRFTFANGVAMGKELDRALLALQAKYPDFVGDERIYTGFSLGAITGVAWITAHATSVAVLTEGSHAQWTPAAIAQFAKGGGKRVLFACGQIACVSAAQRVAASMKKAGLDAKVVHGKGVGHGYGGAVADAISAEIEWVFQ